jgi:hypothetical protein
MSVVGVQPATCGHFKFWGTAAVKLNTGPFPRRAGVHARSFMYEEVVTSSTPLNLTFEPRWLVLNVNINTRLCIMRTYDFLNLWSCCYVHASSP